MLGSSLKRGCSNYPKLSYHLLTYHFLEKISRFYSQGLCAFWIWYSPEWSRLLYRWVSSFVPLWCWLIKDGKFRVPTTCFGLQQNRKEIPCQDCIHPKHSPIYSNYLVNYLWFQTMYCYFFPTVQSHHYFTLFTQNFANIIGVCCLYQNLTFQWHQTLMTWEWDSTTNYTVYCILKWYELFCLF